ncbi:pilus assembly protein PapC [Pseudomonas fluorescens]|uniref:Pilus assembly protein PapC n=1 Tax=Pseudomonas fluorescens TaxID=294 RepID=A0A1T2Y1U3_PSEFL|nr:CS1-pili formation C-terminal domain-containing protein [Pseudomonas fluorescens]OPA86090.1 pilus assembly protein PapC [Pseudomonas fluorescens]
MFPITLIAAALLPLLCFSAYAASEANTGSPKSLLAQAAGLPSDFAEHFFDVPLAVRVELDKQFLGEAIVVLSRDDKVTLIELIHGTHGQIDLSELDTWTAFLKRGVNLGACADNCANDLLAVHYSLENSMLSIVTQHAERSITAPRYYEQPKEGGSGLIVRNQLNLNGGQEQSLGGRYGLEATGSLGSWTQTLGFQMARMGGDDEQLYHAVQELYSQRELQGSFVRLGYFTPSSDGVSLQPRLLGNSLDTTLGVMYGSSDSLAINSAQPSVYPIYVTTNRQASVEIYRNGVLVNTQPVAAGLQTLETRNLPSGIYEVEVRIVEDGQVTSTSRELVYKPNNWGNPDERWRYNVFAGRESQLLSNWEEEEGAEELTAGAAFNYLLHPRVVVGLSGRQIRQQLQYGTTVDWALTDEVRTFVNLYQTQDYGTGVDLQAQYVYGAGSVSLSHNRSWLDTRNTYEVLADGTRLRQRNNFVGQTSSSAVSFNHRVDRKRSINARVSHSQGNMEGVGVDVGLNQQTSLMGSDANWRFSVFDRPRSISTDNQRNRGVELSVNLALGSDGEHWSASLGSRTSRDGERDNNGSIGYRRDLRDHALQSVAATATVDTYGVGVSGLAQFETDLVNGDVFAQRSSYNGSLNGGLNLDSTVVVGGQKLAMTRNGQTTGAGMIIDVESDLDDIVLRADDLSGGSVVLRGGRNFIPITAYKSSSVSFDFEGTDVPAASIQPARAAYHLNKGAVAYRKISVMKTVTVLGRLLNTQGEPLKGHHIINHASRGVSEADGFFSMEMNAGTPTLEVRQGDQLLCQFRIDTSSQSKEDNVLMIGDLQCDPKTLAATTNDSEKAG